MRWRTVGEPETLPSGTIVKVAQQFKGHDMAYSSESISMAIFCDFENVALGVRDAKYERFDITPVLERLLLKGNIVVKKAYCDWERYKGFKAAMNEARSEEDTSELQSLMRISYAVLCLTKKTNRSILSHNI